MMRRLSIARFCTAADPQERQNLSGDPEYRDVIRMLFANIPIDPAPAGLAPRVRD
jgi:hypothetical protein